MIMPDFLERGKLREILQSTSVSYLSMEKLVALFREEDVLTGVLPDRKWVWDPRDNSVTLFNTSRSIRPHDQTDRVDTINSDYCPICEGSTTGVIDVAELSEGFTFINKNLYPIVYPFASSGNSDEDSTFGFHFLQWTSSYHNRDWHNMPLSDRIVVLQRLAALEEKLLYESKTRFTGNGPCDKTRNACGFISIIKNYGQSAGCSLTHGHQQIAFSNVMPGRFQNNISFFQREKHPFSTYMLEQNPGDLVLQDYGPAILAVPYFMKRPYDMILLIKETDRQYLCELDSAEIESIAEGLCDAMKLYRNLLPKLGRDVAFNWVLHNGPGAGVYFEFFPHSQEIGGFEKLGLWVCQSSPEVAATDLREAL